MDPISIAGAGMAGLSSLASMVAGGVQMRRGRKDLEKLDGERPTYEIPGQIREAEGISRARATNPFLPGQQLMEQQVGQQGAQTTQNIKEMGGVADLYMVQAQQNQAMNQIGIQSATQRLQNEMNLLNTLMQVADYEDKAFDYNENIPYQEKRQDALARIGGGMQNLGGALNTLSTMGASMIGMPKKLPTKSQGGVVSTVANDDFKGTIVPVMGGGNFG